MKQAKILSASAGSGKTFQLALKYMCDIIAHPECYRNILAVTFTNKATEEMKSRILREIHTIATGQQSDYIEQIVENLNMSKELVVEQAKIAQTKILHDYSRFSVLTIDRFFQRILRAFIKELSLDMNYNIELDTTMLLERSAEALVESIQKDDDIKKWLIEFAEERLENGSKWDMREDLSSLGRELFKENGAKRMSDNIDKEKLREIVSNLEKARDHTIQKIKTLAEEAIAIMKEYGVRADQFYKSSQSFVFSFYKYAEGELKPPTATMLTATEKPEQWYTKTADGAVKCAAVALMPKLKNICLLYEVAVKQQNTAKLLKDNYRSFALLVDLKRHLTRICSDENIMVLSETKDILADFIDDSNAPFIYEKVGNRYDHYMIDEFQDTSVREWRNLLPLLREALASNKDASVFIVGDVKQSIYRWRGGDWRLLGNDAIDDLGRDNTEVKPLKKNYRSYENVVIFNNKLIASAVEQDNKFLNRHLVEARKAEKVSEETFSSLHNILSKAYSDYEQEPNKENNKGYVEVCAYDSTILDSPFINAIESAIARGYRYRDILILVRNKTHATAVANQLFAYKEAKFSSQGIAGFNIQTPDALTLEGQDITEFIVAVMRLATLSQCDIERGVFNRFLGLPFDTQFSEEEVAFFSHIAHLSPMEAFEAIVSRYALNNRKEDIAFLQAMYEQVVSFSTTNIADINHYLIWWEERGKNESVSVEMTDDTIEITTIHKAKGLERDVVIIPYAVWDMSPKPILKPIVWASADAKGENELASIGDFPVIYGSKMMESAFAEDYYKELIMNHVDGVNLLYVAITRASKELYMYVPTRLNTNSNSENITSTAPLILEATKKICPLPETIINEDKIEQLRYTYGVPTEFDSESKKRGEVEELLLDEYTSTTPSIKVRYPAQRQIDEGLSKSTASMTRGIILHSIFERAKSMQDIKSAIDNMVLNCTIDVSEAEQLERNINEMCNNSIVAEWFDGSWDDIKCESGIIFNGTTKRPDRVMIKGDRVVVLDYKSGRICSNDHKEQVAEYMDILRQMGRYSTIEGYVWYIALGKVEAV